MWVIISQDAGEFLFIFHIPKSASIVSWETAHISGDNLSNIETLWHTVLLGNKTMQRQETQDDA